MTIKIPKSQFITDALIDELKAHYKGLAVKLYDGGIELETGQLTREQTDNLSLDVNFFVVNPYLPIENVCCTLGNYYPRNESQRNVLKFAKALIGLEQPSTSAGLFIYGEPGTGKTHVAVGTAKEFMRKGLTPTYVRADDYPKLNEIERKLYPGQVWIIDDLNSPFGSGMRVFKQIVLNAHNYGGRVFATSNTSFSYLMEHGFVGDEQEKDRFVDRIKGMFKLLHIEGVSIRGEKTWYMGLNGNGTNS